jgi:hypothetical protein
VDINTVDEVNDTNGHPSQESGVTLNAKNSNIDEPDIIHDSSKTIDTNAEQTKSMVDDDAEHNDVSQKELPVQCAHYSEEVNMVDKATDVNGNPSGPKGRPNNLPQPAWRLAELFFWSDLS